MKKWPQISCSNQDMKMKTKQLKMPLLLLNKNNYNNNLLYKLKHNNHSPKLRHNLRHNPRHNPNNLILNKHNQINQINQWRNNSLNRIKKLLMSNKMSSLQLKIIIMMIRRTQMEDLMLMQMLEVDHL